MSFLARTQTAARIALLAGSATAAFAGAPAALADPPVSPPNCTAADLEGVRAGVSASTSAYLFTHPEFNDFVTSLKGRPRDDVGNQMKRYLDAHPDTKTEITGIRQPLVDIKNRCGALPPT